MPSTLDDLKDNHRQQIENKTSSITKSRIMRNNLKLPPKELHELIEIKNFGLNKEVSNQQTGAKTKEKNLRPYLRQNKRFT